jgi:hypothetical protein
MSDDSFIVSSSLETDPDRSSLKTAQDRIQSPSGVAARLRLLEVLGDDAKPMALLVSGPEGSLRSALEDLVPIVRVTPNSQAELLSGTLRHLFMEPLEDSMREDAISTSTTGEVAGAVPLATEEPPVGELPSAETTTGKSGEAGEPQAVSDA